ncbi:thermonuclease family protein [Aneurinibacillus sp. REN35]|uniref:thermonuclease family protein n=1 Tax=Aneurinibacillus sp. REN35 TaxID=3237286 RepID=UPI0035280048
MFRLHDFVFLVWFLSFFAAGYAQADQVSAQYGDTIHKPDGTVTAYVYKWTHDNRILATIKGQTYSIRMQGITVAADPSVRLYVKEKLVGHEIELEYDEQARDVEGNITAYVWVGEEMLNHRLLVERYAKVDLAPEQTRYLPLFTQAQTTAN